jgi:hypothetical protein
MKGCSCVAMNHLPQNYEEYAEDERKFITRLGKDFQKETYLLGMKIASGHGWAQFLHMTVVTLVPFNEHIQPFV